MFETTSIPAISNGKPLTWPCQKSPGDHAVPPASKAFPPGCWTSSCPGWRRGSGSGCAVANGKVVLKVENGVIES